MIWRLLVRFAVKLKNIDGLIDVKFLSQEDISTLKSLEEEAEKHVFMGLARGVNEGVHEVFRRSKVLAMLTNMAFQWPSEPTVKLFFDGVMVGEEIRDKKKLAELKAAGHIHLGSFILYRERLKEKRSSKNGVIIIPHIKVVEIDKIKEIKNPVVGSPSLLSDEYLKSLFKSNAPGQGTLLIGFD